MADRALTVLQRKVLETLVGASGSLTTEQIAKKVGKSPGPVRHAVTALQTDGLAYRVNTHWWNPTATGMRLVRHG